jgi:NAD(P)H-flavin reductase
MQVRTISGKFILLENTNPKIFIATGTGLAPIYRMIMGMDDDTRKSLYFSVSTEAELFYVDELRAIENLELHIHVTREKVA